MHRQTACAAIKHMALGVYGFGCEDALIHLLNHVWPNIFETSPHLVQAFMDAVEGMRVALGPIKILQYALQVNKIRKQFVFLIFLYINDLWCYFRAYSIQLERSVMFTGRYITHYISEAKTPWSLVTHGYKMIPTIILSDTS